MIDLIINSIFIFSFILFCLKNWWESLTPKKEIKVYDEMGNEIIIKTNV